MYRIVTLTFVLYYISVSGTAKYEIWILHFIVGPQAVNDHELKFRYFLLQYTARLLRSTKKLLIFVRVMYKSYLLFCNTRQYEQCIFFASMTIAKFFRNYPVEVGWVVFYTCFLCSRRLLNSCQIIRSHVGRTYINCFLNSSSLALRDISDKLW